MKPNQRCPEVEELRKLLDGTLSGDRQQACTNHMDSCHGCQSKLEGIATGGSNLSQVIEHLDDSEPPANSGYWKAAQALEDAVQETFVPASSVRRRDLTLDFLDPASDSAYLGRIAQFDVMRILGRGGMGVVLEAFDSRLQRNVALKVLDPELAGDDVARQRFCREARAAASITHENVVAVHQVEKSGEAGLPFLVMQLISGESLDQRLTREKKLPIREIVRISLQVAHGLAAAYEQGLIHRDIKPGNILLEDSHDSVKLTDFGLARVVDDVKLTRTGFVSGTPLYMAPEQAIGAEADHRSDLFSLGAIMYEMCAGEPPFSGDSALMILKQITDAKHRPIREINPAIPDWLAETVDRLLAKNPADRIQSATLLAELLEFQLALMKTAEDLPTVCKIKQARQRLRNRWIAVAIGASFLVLGVLAGVFIANRPHPAAPLVAAPPVAEVSDAEPIAVLSGNSGTIWSANFDPASQSVVMGVEDGSVRLWDLQKKSVKSTLTAHRGVVWTSKFSRDGQLLATSGDDGSIKIWKPSVSSEPVKIFKHTNGVRGIEFSHDDQTLYGVARDGGLRAWSMDSDQPIAEAQQPSAIYAVAISPDDETLATAGSDKIVRLWNAKSLTQKLPLEGHTGPVYGLSFDPEGRQLASVGWDKQIHIWDAASGIQLKTWDAKGADIWGVAFSPNGKILATGGHDGAVKLWNVETGEKLASYLGHDVAVHTVNFNRDGSLLASGGRDGAVRIWKIE